jgi:hypothetical protein
MRVSSSPAREDAYYNQTGLIGRLRTRTLLMTDSGTLLIIFLIVLIAVIAAWSALFIVSSQYKRWYLAIMGDITQALQEAYDQLEALRRFALEAPSDEDPPYGLMVADLNARVSKATEGYRSCVAQADVLEQTQPLLPPRLQDRIVLAPSQLRPWREQLGRAQELIGQIETLQKQVAGALQQGDEIHRLPISIAGRVRSVWGASERVLKACQTLQAIGVIGEGLDSVIATVQTHRRVLGQLPEYYRQDSDEVVMVNATPQSVRDAWQKLGNVERPVYDALRRVQGWQSAYDETKNMVSELQAELSTAERVLKQLPASIDASQHAAEYDELRANTGVIQTTWRAPEVHRLADLSNAATLQIGAIQQWTVGVMSVHKTYQGLEQAVTSNDRLIERIEGVMDGLAQALKCRVKWTSSAAELGHLQTMQASIGATTQSRNPARLVTDLDNSLDLGLQAETLEARVNDARDSHRQLVTLVDTPEFQTRDQWFHDVAALHIDAMVYSRDNWSDQEGVANLKTDAMTLLKREQDLRPLMANEPVSEDEIEQWIMHAGAYVRERRGLQARLDSITKKLREMVRSEKAAQTDIMQMQAALGKLDRAIEQNIRASAVMGAWNETMSLRDDGRHLAETLEGRASGTVAAKASAVTQWQQECLDAIGNLSQGLKTEAGGARQNLTAQVEALVEIAPLDTEPSMMTAQQLLNEVPARQIGAKSARDGGSVAADINTIGAMIDQINSTYQRYMHLAESLDDLEHRVVVQLEPRVTRLDAAHAAAVGTLKELQSLQRQIPFVKPLQVTCEEADQMNELFSQAEAGLEDMTANGRTVKSVVSRLDGLIQQFQHIANHGAGAQADIERDLARLQAVWDQYNQWVRQLKRYRDLQARTDRELSEEVDGRLTEIDQHFLDIQRRYKGRPLALDSACRELEVLLRDTSRDIEVQRDTGIEVLTAQTIMNA